jgi:hypothetical protein
MTTELKILANRQNAKKSTGPKTKTGKYKASRNAVRHGLEAVDFGISGHFAEVERLAMAICPDASDPFRYEQAIIIAESQILLARVRAARSAAIERAGQNVVELLEWADMRTLRKIIGLASKSLRQSTSNRVDPAKASQCRDDLIQAIAPFRLLREKSTPQALDETERLGYALPYLLKLERYERRALSRRRRAIRRFDALAD